MIASNSQVNHAMLQNELLIENIDRLHTTQKNSIHKIEKRTDMQISRFFISGDIKGAIEYMRDREEFKDILPAYVAIFEDRKYRTYEVPDALNNILRLYQIYFRDTFYCGIPEQDAAGKLLAELRALLNIPDADEALLAEQLRSAFEAEGYHALFGKNAGLLRSVYLAGDCSDRLPCRATGRNGEIHGQHSQGLRIQELDGLSDLRAVRYRRLGVSRRHDQLC